MEKVSDFYWNVRKNLGKQVASEFINLMKNWDGSANVSNAFYGKDLLEMKLKEAQEKI